MFTFLSGAFTGACITVFLFCMLVTGSDDDDREGRG